MAKISATIITDNSIATIGRCLESLAGIADEIIVVDAFSSDGTVEVCNRYGCKVKQRKLDGYGAQKQYAVSLATNSYVLSIDADEYLDDDLRRSILRLKEQGFEHRIYSFSRLNFFGGKPVKHSGWWPDRQTRLFDKRYASWNLRDVHERVLVHLVLAGSISESQGIGSRASPQGDCICSARSPGASGFGCAAHLPGCVYACRSRIYAFLCFQAWFP